MSRGLFVGEHPAVAGTPCTDLLLVGGALGELAGGRLEDMVRLGLTDSWGWVESGKVTLSSPLR